MICTRRRLLGLGGAIAGMAAASGFVRPADAREPIPANSGAAGKRIALKNLHTGEELESVFFSSGAYVGASFAAIQVLLRDFRNDQQHAIDPKLMDYLFDVAQQLGVDPVFSVISGYRSPQTNALLRERSSGVARHSMHLEGRAIDVRIAGVDCTRLAGRALDLARGGVGYYRASDFVHLDTGAFRTWKG
ncbi:MAG TPA: DUF882 domain-containing protein [Steroidobacteraceae bacterium]|nr:DUF882 domain-containing protein [Steroidobacteraceae bacterium]